LGHASESNDITDGDLLVKVIVDDTIKNLKRVIDDIHCTIEISLLEAIFGCRKEVEDIENSKLILDLNPGLQADENMIFHNKVNFLYNKKGFLIPENQSRGKMIINFKIKIPSSGNFCDKHKNDIKTILNSLM